MLSILNSKKLETDPLQNLVRQQLGKLDRLLTFVKLFLPWFAMLVFWCVLNKPLVTLGILPASKSWAHLLEQGAVTGLNIYLAWKYLIIGFLLLHLVNSYIYFGPGPLWIFVDRTARRILKPTSWIPLRFGKIDFAPAIAIALVILAAIYAPRELFLLYQRLSF